MRTLDYVIIAFIAIVVLIFTASILRAGPEYGKTRLFVDSLFIFGALIAGIGGSSRLASLNLLSESGTDIRQENRISKLRFFSNIEERSGSKACSYSFSG